MIVREDLHTTMSETTAERLYRELKRQIVICTIAPGRSLSEKEICEEFSASRTPVREACRRLENERLIQIVPYRGYTVAPVTLQDFHNLHEMQLIIDPASAALAASRASTAQLKTLEKIALQSYKPGSSDSYYTFLQTNFDFHIGISNATRNTHLIESTVAVQTRLMRFFYLIISMDAFSSVLMEEHHQIISALLARDSEKAREAAVNHVRQTNRRGTALFSNPQEFEASSVSDFILA